MGWTKNFGNPTGRFGRMIVSSMNQGHAPISVWGLEHFRFSDDTNALDIGCGGGMNLKRMLNSSPNGMICGIDISDESLKISREVNERYLGKRCFIEKGSSRYIPFEDNKFDLVTAFETIYFWQEIPECFEEIKRVLKANGTFMVVNEITNPKSIWNRVVEGMNVPSLTQLKQYFTDAGFVDIKIDKKGEWIAIKGRKA